MSTLTRIARLLAQNEDAARDFCLRVQGYYKSNKPPFATIAEFLEKDPAIPRQPDTVARAMQAAHSAEPENIQHVSMREAVEILDHEHNLDAFLRSVRNSKVDIATAFASKTENLVETMLLHGNRVTLTVGTINHFSDPVFIKHFQELVTRDPRVKLYVDFRGDDSIHWKLYLIAPDTVIIGSPNLTRTGLSMKRDTAIRLQNASLYQAYLSLLDKLKQNHEVIISTAPDFNSLLAQYERQHTEIISTAVQPTEIVPDFATWIAQDKTQILRIFIWSREATSEEEREFEDHVQPAVTNGINETGIGNASLIGFYEAPKNHQYYSNGNVILMMKASGAHIEFKRADVVTYGMGKWWLCGFEGLDFHAPFALTPALRKVIRDRCESWLKVNKRQLNSKDLRELASQLQSQGS